ncbi:hypothetical protein [Falsiroseomonas sp.]|uniref:hypothetical protein n=1 Tax=Falsiroseomonas sp. TaxID=2870721 RepID=UPI0035661AD8
MLTRNQRTTIVFRRPFLVKGIDRPQPAGVYDVETEEELLEGLSFPAYRRVSTMIMLQAPQAAAFLSAHFVDAGELAEAQAIDARDPPATWRT